MDSSKHTELANHAWSVADLLRGDYKQSDYGKVILPFTVLRRLECVLEPTRDVVAAEAAKYKELEGFNADSFLRKASGHSFYNTSTLTLKKIAADQHTAADNLRIYMAAFSQNAREVLETYEFGQHVKKLADAGLLYQVIGKFTDLDLHPERVSNHNMGYVFEELIRRFAEQSNETAGEHFTPREVIKLMVNLLIAPDGDALTLPGTVRTVMDPACGTGGMLSAADDFIKKFNEDADVELYGQELNPESWAICRSDLMIKGQDPENVAPGNSFNNDGHGRRRFDYLLANPPFGVEWKKVKEDVEYEHKTLGEAGRFAAGLPRINDGSLLFLQHMISKMKPVDAQGKGGSRIAIVFNGSPLFTGAAGSGESEIRRWILENDWLEAIVALPDQLFYNTGISTYFWILTNRKSPDHKGKVVLLDARDQWVKMRKSLGDKRKELGDGANGRPDHIGDITRLYGEAVNAARDENHPMHAKVKVFDNEAFGYQRITVERPLKLRFEVTEETLTALAAAKPVQKLADADAFVGAVRTLLGSSWATKSEAFVAMKDAVVAAGLLWPSGAPFAKAMREAVGVRDPEGEVQRVKGEPEPDADLRDFENVPLGEDVEEYLKREVLPHVPDAWIDHAKTKTGYEIPFTRHFYVYEPPRPLAEIDAELKALEAEIQGLLGEVTE
ncbi:MULTISPECIES: type I restriction-modification system subunit M [Streptomyces]|uniref:site-specific DNA-methyltransferase (adenine-specific) n=2 Tax=Streptomyces diastaticus group TaxID=2849069 RepID=A0A8H9HKA9_9ACTN|nr:MULTISPECIES: class I SAM-dependent DNA methyltransferase [Streptomyces]MDQ0293209.1 type I restriction enzyme M protein [Streptomyces sp. DSM 41037]GFH74566.1 DNA methyltransferase [Streptomyces diastaticus subsp. diastaticus]GFH76869.1 DNA methyltransferase [Streptomyces gougerotii]GGU03911.1 DNA methyltransferase [Streptomyces diastaticus subsp. diastaticus]GGU65438.1 DNA methyltransferase [Streptomyces gougerotii]